MISGKVHKVVSDTQSHLIMMVNGIGYKIFCSSQLLQRAHEGDELTLHTHLVVKEDVLDLFGFESVEDQALFNHLIGVNGVGPKTAIGILNSPATEILQAIEQGDVHFFTQFPRVGKRMAHNIIIELKTSASELTSLGLTSQSPQMSELHDALTKLGYPSSSVLTVLRELDHSQDESVLMKQAITALATRSSK